MMKTLEWLVDWYVRNTPGLLYVAGILFAIGAGESHVKGHTVSWLVGIVLACVSIQWARGIEREMRERKVSDAIMKFCDAWEAWRNAANAGVQEINSQVRK